MTNLKVVEEVITNTDVQDDSIFIACNGVKLKLKKVSSRIATDAMRAIPMPTVPYVYIEDKERNEENPNDPDYLQAVQDTKNERGSVLMDIYFVMGSELYEIPTNGVEPPDSIAWSDVLLNVLNKVKDGILNIPESGRLRYLCWLKYYALEDKDQVDLLAAILRYCGTATEEDVSKALDSFRSDEGRG